MAESEPSADGDDKISSKKPSRTGEKSRRVGHIKMIVIEDLKSETIRSSKRMLVIDSDDSNSYGKLKEAVKEHHPEVIPKKDIGKVLPRVHIVISHAKRQLPDIYHQIDPRYLQNYLNEFCYRFHRRYFGEFLFDRLLIAAVTYKNQFRYNGR